MPLIFMTWLATWPALSIEYLLSKEFRMVISPKLNYISKAQLLIALSVDDLRLITQLFLALLF